MPSDVSSSIQIASPCASSSENTPPLGAVNANNKSSFERRYIGDQAGPGFIARMMLDHDDVVFWPPASFHLRVGETIGNPDLPRLLMQAHLYAGTWVEGRRDDHPGLWRANRTHATSRS